MTDPLRGRFQLEEAAMRQVLRWATWLLLLAAGGALVVRPARAPWLVLPALSLSLVPLVRTWRAAHGTALRAAIAWGMVAVALGMVAEWLAISEPLATGRPFAGHVTYLCTLSALAALISVLNARTPGGGAWAILMALMVLVFLIPWLEGAGLGRGPHALRRLRLDNPWTIFYGLLVVAGVTNYLPTRFGLAAAWLGLGFALEYVGLTRPELSASVKGTLWAAVPWTFAAALATADLRAGDAPRGSSRLEGVWFWFRDHWGVVWALRVQERFNRSAETLGWPVRLAWHGVVLTPPEATAVPVAAEATLRGLLRRFATPERIEQAVPPDVPSCHQADAR
jgi:hypothetical protein